MLRPTFAFCALSLVAAPAAAATYVAKPAGSPPAKIAASDILWKCDAETCVGATRNSRPLVLCQELAKKAGRIESFRVDGRDISAAELERCNASVAKKESKAVANAR